MFKDKVFFEKINNKNVFCVLSEPDDNKKQIVIFNHGFRSSTIGPARTFVDFSRILNKEGISTLRFDQPNCGNSEGDFLNSSFNEWVNTTAYFAKKYLDLGYKVILLGQSMGATTTVIASNKNELKGKIPCIILWVPDPKTTFDGNPNEIAEEGGQIHSNKFWQEAKESNFFDCLNNYNGKIHLVYGENDMYISEELRSQVVDVVKNKNQEVMILPNQNHSSWEHKITQKVFEVELPIIKSSFEG